MNRSTMPTARLMNALGLLVVLGLFGALAVEAFLRATTSSPRWVNQRYMEISRGFADLDDLIADWDYHRIAYHDEFLYASRPATSDHVSFSDYFGARLTPASAPLHEADYVVWTFGGSTMENLETTDSLTIANVWAREFGRALGPTHVKNFGAGGFFSSYELIKFQRLLREAPDHEHPHLAIFYDGYNDAVNGFQYGAGSIQPDLSLKLRALVEGRTPALWIYATSQALERVSMLWERTGAQVVGQAFFPLGTPDPSEDNLLAAVRVYTSNVRMLRSICDAYDIRCFFLLQPMLMTKEPLAPLEQEALAQLEAHPRMGTESTHFVREFYRRSRHVLEHEEGFIDASGVLDGRTEADFYDPGHVSALTPPVIGSLTAALILRRLGERESP